MSIKSKANTEGWNDNYDETFKGKASKDKTTVYYRVVNSTGKCTAKFTDLKEAEAYAKKYPRDAEGGILGPENNV